MKSLTQIIFICFLLFTTNSQAQFWKNLGKKVEDAAERTVERKSQQKTEKEVSKGFDSVFNNGEKRKNKKKRKNKRRKEKDSDVIGSSSKKNSEKNSKTVNSSKDFTPGNKVIYSDTFKNDAIGDFPVTWNTNASGEVVTFGGDDTRWLQLESEGQYTPDGITNLPDNFTFEVDVAVSDNFDFYSEGLWINFVEVKNRKKDFTQWSRFGRGKDGLRFRIKPKNFEYTGESEITSVVDGDELLKNIKNNKQFTIENNPVHIAVWRQKNRLRVYLNDEKVWDIPRAFDDANYNAIVFSTSGRPEEHFYVSNLRLAVAGEDTRHALLETGRFETSDIHFDVNKASLKPDSYPILNDLGQILKENPSVKIKVIGHTDSDGSEEANLKLSQKRAEAIKTYLITNFNVASSRISTEGKGESQPIASNSTSEGKAKNRRVEFIKL
jgi:outer membrane protein OmpA-like peptidoglycan-associated protein